MHIIGHQITADTGQQGLHHWRGGDFFRKLLNLLHGFTQGLLLILSLIRLQHGAEKVDIIKMIIIENTPELRPQEKEAPQGQGNTNLLLPILQDDGERLRRGAAGRSRPRDQALRLRCDENLVNHPHHKGGEDQQEGRDNKIFHLDIHRECDWRIERDIPAALCIGILQQNSPAQYCQQGDHQSLEFQPFHFASP